MSYPTTPSVNASDDTTVARHLELTVHALLRAITAEAAVMLGATPDERGTATWRAKNLAEAVASLACWPNMNPHSDVVTTLEKLDTRLSALERVEVAK